MCVGGVSVAFGGYAVCTSGYATKKLVLTILYAASAGTRIMIYLNNGTGTYILVYDGVLDCAWNRRCI